MPGLSSQVMVVSSVCSTEVTNSLGSQSQVSELLVYFARRERQGHRMMVLQHGGNDRARAGAGFLSARLARGTLRPSKNLSIREKLPECSARNESRPYRPFQSRIVEMVKPPLAPRCDPVSPPAASSHTPMTTRRHPPVHCPRVPAPSIGNALSDLVWPAYAVEWLLSGLQLNRRPARLRRMDHQIGNRPRIGQNPMDHPDVTDVGGGHDGLTATRRLRAAGKNVRVLARSHD